MQGDLAIQSLIAILYHDEIKVKEKSCEKVKIGMLLSKGYEPIIVSGQSNDLSRDLPPGLPDSLARDIAINQVQHSTIYLC